VIVVTENLTIPASELTFSASRSGGPGGQNVNKVSSRVTVTFDVMHSPSLSEDQRLRIASRLQTRINKDGVLRVISQRTRSQEMNREDALARFIEMLQNALRVQTVRVKTRIPGAARTQRLEQKKKRGETKQSRSTKVWD
jgi:ribosome-associated protein